MSTSEYLDGLTIDQLRFAREEADKRIKKAEAQPKKIVWVVSNGSYTVSWHREEDYENAVKSYIKTLETDVHVKWAFEDTMENRTSMRSFENNFPSLRGLYQNEVEYEEWFK